MCNLIAPFSDLVRKGIVLVFTNFAEYTIKIEMPTLNQIPTSYKDGFILMALMKDDEFKEMEDGLSLASFTSSIKKLAESVAATKSLENKKIEKVFYSIGGLVFILEKKESINEIAEDAYNLLRDSKFKKENEVFEFSKTDKSIFVNRVSALLNSEKLYYAAKANSLKEESSNVYIQSKVITDMRPIYSLNVEDTPTKGVVIHNLHIHFASGDDGHKDIYFAISPEELRRLKEILTRAEKKELGLINIFKGSNIENIS